VIVYSWTDAGDPACNRQFLHDCLASALATLGRDGLELIDVQRDSDATLTALCDADLVVADVSLAQPNVMFELGYAMAKRGPSAVIAIVNTALGPLDVLPAPLRRARVIRYALSTAANQGSVRDELVAQLAQAIEACLGDREAERAARLSRGIDALIQILVYGTDLEDRADGPTLARDAGELLALAREIKVKLHGQLESGFVELVDKAVATLEKTAALPNNETNWSRIRAGLAAACSNLELGSRDFLRTIPVAPATTQHTIETIRELIRWSADAIERFELLGDQSVPADDIRSFDELSYAVRRLAEFSLLPEHPSFIEQLHPIAVTIRKALLSAQREGTRSGRAWIGCVQIARDELTRLLAAYELGD
jgi:hypothetical protein